MSQDTPNELVFDLDQVFTIKGEEFKVFSYLEVTIKGMGFIFSILKDEQGFPSHIICNKLSKEDEIRDLYLIISNHFKKMGKGRISGIIKRGQSLLNKKSCLYMIIFNLKKDYRYRYECSDLEKLLKEEGFISCSNS